MKVTEIVVQALLMRWVLNVKHHIITIPNAHDITIGEGDLFSVTKAMFLHEYEIKISKSDFNQEFRNKKHKHQRMGYGMESRVPNYFWFVIHGFKLELSDLPKYAGLIKVVTRPSIYVKGDFKLDLKIVRKAPRIHQAKLKNKTILSMARKLSWRVYGTQKSVLKE